MERRIRPLAICASIAAAFAASCGSGEPARVKPRLVLLYATCTLNKGYLAPYDESVTFTPSLDAFAKESVVFRRHESESGQSGISFASIFSGTQADKHGVYTHPTSLPDDLYLITEAFADAGYEPFFWGGHSMAAYDLNYAQGVAPENVFEPTKPNAREKKLSFLQADDAQFQRVLERLEVDPDYRAFLLVDFTVTHGLYHKQQERPAYARFLAEHPEASNGKSMDDLVRAWAAYEAERFELQWNFPGVIERTGLTDGQVAHLADCLEVTYRADVARLDTMFGNTLDELRRVGVLDESLVAFTADHGETLLREGTLFKWTHGLQLAPEVLSVPWIVRSPLHGLEPGSYDGVTRSIDVYPTLAGLCGIPVGGRGIDGVDLSPALIGEEPPRELVAWSHTTTISDPQIENFRSYALASKYWGTMEPDRIWARARHGDMVYKWRNEDGETFGPQVFDLARDPYESNDLFDASNPEHVERIDAVKAYRDRLIRGFDGRGTDAPSDALERLKDLGYVEGED